MGPWFKWLVLTFIGGLLLIAVGVVSFVAYPHKLFTTEPAIWKVEHAEGLHRGEALRSKLLVCKYTPRTADIMLLWAGVTDSGDVYVRVLPTTSGSLPQGCRTAVFHIVDIPQSVPSGRYRVTSVMRYDMGLTVVEHGFSTEEFRVLP